MCTVIRLTNGDIETIGQLAAYLGSTDFVYRYGRQFKSETCLCPVDIPETLQKFGVTFEYDDFPEDYCIPSVEAIHPVEADISL